MVIRGSGRSKERLKLFNSKIINSITPFASISYDKTKKVKIFIGREDNLRTLSEVLFKSVFSEQSFGLSISGPGGCGKSTLFGYFTQLINNQNIFQKNYCQLKKDESKIITCFIDAPKGEPTTLKYFWASIIDALAEDNIEFLEKFAIQLIIKCLDVLWKSKFKQEKLKEILTIFIPNFNENIQHHSISQLITIANFFDIYTSEEELSQKIKNIINTGWRILQKYEVTFGLLNRSGNFNQKRIFKFQKRYFDLLFQVLSSDIEISSKAQNIFKGVDGVLLNSDKDVSNLFNWLTQIWEWVEEKPVCFLIGVDNIGYLTVDVEEQSSAYIPFVQTILQMRESLKKFLFILIGTNEDWRVFNDYIREHQDYRSQLQGFLIRRIDLTRLRLDEVHQALSLIINKFWSTVGMIYPSNPLYPFSPAFFSYLYEYYAHDYRSILIALDKIWHYYKSHIEVFPLEDPFTMINFVRMIMPEIDVKEIYFSNLIEWEKEVIKNSFMNLKSRHIGKKQSDIVEKKIADVIGILQENEIPKQIDWVESTYPISISLEKGKRTRIPDVYVKLTPQSIMDKKKTFEIQVKMYDKHKFVKLNDIESSIELLERAHTDALLFLMTGAGLEEKALDKFKELNLVDRLLYAKPLNDEQFKALTFLIAYEQIMNKKPTINMIKEILEILFEQAWDDLLENIRSIGSFRETRIMQEIKKKQSHTMEKYLSSEPAKQTIQESEEMKEILAKKVKISNETEIITNLEDVKSKDDIIDGAVNLDKIIEENGLKKSEAIIKTNYNRYKSSMNELKFIFKCATKRTDRYNGRATKDYLKKRVPAHLADENVSELFLRLKNEFTKKRVPADELLFSYKGTSIIITEMGKNFLKILNTHD